MLSTLTQSLLPIMGWFAFGSVVGGIYYLLMLRLRQRPGGEGMVLAIILALPIAWAFVLNLSFLDAFFMLNASSLLTAFFGGLLTSLGGAYAERKIERVESSYFTCIATLWCAGLLGMGTCAGLLIVSTVYSLVASLVISLGPNVEWRFWGLFVGIMTTPSAIPTFIYLWRSSQMRPGVDRPLVPSEIADLKR